MGWVNKRLAACWVGELFLGLGLLPQGFDISAKYFAIKSATKSRVAPAAFVRLISMSFFFAGTKSDLGSDMTYCSKPHNFSRSSYDSLSSWKSNSFAVCSRSSIQGYGRPHLWQKSGRL